MENLDIYSKKNLERFVNDLLCYLHSKKTYRASTYNDERLSRDVLLYTLNNRYYVDEKDYTYKFRNVPIKVEENMPAKEWNEYYNEKTLTLRMDCILDEYLYYYDVPGCEEVCERVSDIFEKHGFYMDFGSNTIIVACTKDDGIYRWDE